MSSEPNKKRSTHSRNANNVPFSNTVHRYFVEILLFILVIVCLIAYIATINGCWPKIKEAQSEKIMTILLMAVGGICGKISKKDK